MACPTPRAARAGVQVRGVQSGDDGGGVWVVVVAAPAVAVAVAGLGGGAGGGGLAAGDGGAAEGRARDLGREKRVGYSTYYALEDVAYMQQSKMFSTYNSARCKIICMACLWGITAPRQGHARRQ